MSLIQVVVNQAGEQAEAGLATRDWLVPAISGLAGAAGALGAQVIGRRSQLSVEALRAVKEEGLAERREGHEVEAEKRAARGIAAALVTDFERRRITLDDAGESGEWWPPHVSMKIELPRPEQVALAAWVGDPSWGVIVAPLPALVGLDRRRAGAALDGEGLDVESMQPFKDTIEAAIGVLRVEIDGVLRQSVAIPAAATEVASSVA